MQKMRVFPNDETEYLNDETKKAVGKLIVFYVYNPNIVTHLCSFSRSYWCIPVGMFTQNEIDDDLYNELLSCNDSDYFGQSLESNKIYKEYDLCPYEGDDCDHDDLDYKLLMPDLVEYLQGNQADYELELIAKLGIDY